MEEGGVMAMNKNNNILKEELAEYNNSNENDEVKLIKKQIAKKRTGFIVTLLLTVILGVICTAMNDWSLISSNERANTLQLALGMALGCISSLYFLDMVIGISALKEYSNKEKD